MGNILVTRSSMPPFEEYIDEIKVIWVHMAYKYGS